MYSYIITFFVLCVVVNANLMPYDQFDDIKKDLELRSCNNHACAQSCRRIGYPGGVCVNGRCKCYNNKMYPSPEDGVKDAVTSVDEESPVVADVANADKDKNANADNIGVTFALDSFTSPRACSAAWCNNACRRLGYRGGNCVSAYVCRCY